MDIRRREVQCRLPEVVRLGQEPLWVGPGQDPQHLLDSGELRVGTVYAEHLLAEAVHRGATVGLSLAERILALLDLPHRSRSINTRQGVSAGVCVGGEQGAAHQRRKELDVDVVQAHPINLGDETARVLGIVMPS